MEEIGASGVESVNSRASLQHVLDGLSRSHAVIQANVNIRVMPGPDKGFKSSIEAAGSPSGSVRNPDLRMNVVAGVELTVYQLAELLDLAVHAERLIEKSSDHPADLESSQCLAGPVTTRERSGWRIADNRTPTARGKHNTLDSGSVPGIASVALRGDGCSLADVYRLAERVRVPRQGHERRASCCGLCHGLARPPVPGVVGQCCPVPRPAARRAGRWPGGPRSASPRAR